jgi:hypothetical protein
MHRKILSNIHEVSFPQLSYDVANCNFKPAAHCFFIAIKFTPYLHALGLELVGILLEDTLISPG